MLGAPAAGRAGRGRYSRHLRGPRGARRGRPIRLPRRPQHGPAGRRSGRPDAGGRRRRAACSWSAAPRCSTTTSSAAQQNALLLLNAVDYLAGSPDLLNIRSKTLTQRVIKPVDAKREDGLADLRRAAGARWSWPSSASCARACAARKPPVTGKTSNTRTGAGPLEGG